MIDSGFICLNCGEIIYESEARTEDNNYHARCKENIDFYELKQ